MNEMKIPKIIHQIWIGPKDLPNEYKKYMTTWKDHHPDWQVILWTDENLPELINQKLYDEAKLITEKADIARYELVYMFGGVYVDADFECFKNLEPLLLGSDGFLVKDLWGDFYSNGIFGVVPKHQAMKELIESLPNWVKKNSKKPVNVKTGPHFFTNALKDKDDFDLHKSDLFFPYKIHEKEKKHNHFPDAYAAHHWKTNSGTWE